MPQVVSFLKSVLPEAQHALLLSYQQRVIKSLVDKKKAGEEEGGDEIKQSLETDLPMLKALVQDAPTGAAAAAAAAEKD